MHIRKGSQSDLTRLEGLPQAEPWNRHLAMLGRSLGTRECVVAEIRSEVVGMAVWDRDFFARAFIWMLGVHPNHHRQGVASALIERVESLCKGESLFTSTNKSNAPMQALLKGRSYLETGFLDNLDPGDPEIFFYKVP
ncbi:MAG: GNAT family N-acetyltransferase [Candidatus Baltobacteraceae bacterium]